MSGEERKRPAPFILYVECCYEDAEHKKPVAKLHLSDESIVRLTPGEGYLGNDAGKELLQGLKGLFDNCSMVHTRWGENSNQREAAAAIEQAHAAVTKAER